MTESLSPEPNSQPFNAEQLREALSSESQPYSNALNAQQLIEVLSTLDPDTVVTFETWNSFLEMYFQHGIASLHEDGRITPSVMLNAFCKDCHPDAEAQEHTH